MAKLSKSFFWTICLVGIHVLFSSLNQRCDSQYHIRYAFFSLLFFPPAYLVLILYVWNKNFRKSFAYGIVIAFTGIIIFLAFLTLVAKHELLMFLSLFFFPIFSIPLLVYICSDYILGKTTVIERIVLFLTMASFFFLLFTIANYCYRV